MMTQKTRGFTLIELLVVIAIIAILAVVGIAVYTSLLPGTRDAARRSDVNAIADAWEARFNAGMGTYPELSGSFFSSGVIPTDPDGTGYVVTRTPTTGSAINIWRVCATLDDNVTTYCRSHAQGP